ncbi:MAG: bifunctional DNA-formamidopyrimidine glycosylase/DNA-(apurinic or apyrimidinic site) lyase [Candidatus Omnitrophica bacterium]|nr:bifunctional DNA-formamidopyrimidine glycosylase/DNA-(apurinic or apyrimidinic site) lyase [Candidatus Omnitrophota bacterium]
MPELPEVETIKRDLEKIIIGKKITKVCVHNPAVVREPGVEKFKKILTGVSVKRVLRRAKVLILELSNGKSLVIHLRMTGQLVYPGDELKSRVSFHLSNGKILDFNDQRLFGELRLMDDWRTLKFIQGLGPEPFDITPGQFKEMLVKKKTKIKPLLMDQAFVSGIGNLYAAEALFRAKIDPKRSAQGLSDAEKEKLFQAINKVLQEAIHYGGSSIDDYVRVSGERGNYARHHKVYGRDGKPCFVCKTLIKRIALGGRGTYFCPRCQH